MAAAPDFVWLDCRVAALLAMTGWVVVIVGVGRRVSGLKNAFVIASVARRTSGLKKSLLAAVAAAPSV